MKAFEAAFRKAGMGNVVDDKLLIDKVLLIEKLKGVNVLLKKGYKLREDIVLTIRLAKAHRNKFFEKTKDNPMEHFTGLINPLNTDIWKTGVKAMLELPEINEGIADLEAIQKNYRTKLSILNKKGVEK